MKVSVYTLGCKVNQYESEVLKKKFSEKGYETAAEGEFADVFIVNTCTVTALADRKSRQYIRRMKKLNPDGIIAVTGCYVQVSPDDVSAVEGVDIIAGTYEKKDLPEYIERYIEQRKKNAPADKPEKHLSDSCEDEICEDIFAGSSERTRAYVKIQEGCNRFCSYCVIPYARGSLRSRSEDDILKEARFLVENGFKEIVLTGINTALYGVERDGRLHMAELLETLDRLPGDFRIRLSSLEPTVVNADYVKRILRNDRLCHHLHLSVQSGSSRVLKAMNRRYDRIEYMEIVKVLRDFDPGYGISTDIIAGFPGETEEDFRESLSVISETGFCKVHPFRYSVRPGTAAEKMDGHIPVPEKKKRTSMLEAEGEKAAKAFFKQQKGSIRRVLTEQNTEDGSFITGYTDNYIKVYIPQRDNLMVNEFYDVRLCEVFEDGMTGETV